MTTPTPTPAAGALPAVPDLLEELVPWLDAQPMSQWGAHRLRLTERIGRDGADALFDRAEREIMHGREIDSLRASLRNHLDSAGFALGGALATLDALASDRVYDVEYAEGQAAEDMRAFLADAQRFVRAARALNPVPEQPE